MTLTNVNIMAVTDQCIIMTDAMAVFSLFPIPLTLTRSSVDFLYGDV